MINILPYNQKKAVHRLRVLRVLTVVFSAGTILLVIAAALFFPTLMTINSRFALVDRQVTDLKVKGALPEAVNIEDLKTRTIAITAKLAATVPPPPMEYVDTIRALTGNGITVRGFSMERLDVPTVGVNGVASNRAALQQFVAQLQKQPNVASVDSPISNFVKSSQSQFTVSIVFK